ncbi:hypothetical protein TRFO_41498 [Tritrichomonas foetus]|uniref:Uncharacterized protein n=1 Tax=Tritrichomonas foetus TaxID=1144522 RepID=A0A1J4L4K6_9EUKA|nr:hypothetical protein TRFO_41498 [Tritrichomonas foetus]|eukprot:OHT16870.1 hypothetical protein TRFO_41498 [Tritrichomonas foetus]
MERVRAVMPYRIEFVFFREVAALTGFLKDIIVVSLRVVIRKLSLISFFRCEEEISSRLIEVLGNLCLNPAPYTAYRRGLLCKLTQSRSSHEGTFEYAS